MRKLKVKNLQIARSCLVHPEHEEIEKQKYGKLKDLKLEHEELKEQKQNRCNNRCRKNSMERISKFTELIKEVELWQSG